MGTSPKVESTAAAKPKADQEIPNLRHGKKSCDDGPPSLYPEVRMKMPQAIESTSFSPRLGLWADPEVVLVNLAYIKKQSWVLEFGAFGLGFSGLRLEASGCSLGFRDLGCGLSAFKGCAVVI